MASLIPAMRAVLAPAGRRALTRLRAARALLWIAAPITAAGCARPSEIPGLVARFERKVVCPASRIVVRERADLRVHHFACHEQPAWRATHARGRPWMWDALPFWGLHQDAASLPCGPPPAAIQDDPERVRHFEEIRDARFRALDGDQGVSILELSGCGARRFYVCGLHNACSDLGADDPAEER
jgi:hypothetical protein